MDKLKANALNEMSDADEVLGAAFEDSPATHLITGVTYGGVIVMEFKIKGKLDGEENKAKRAKVTSQLRTVS